MLRVMLCRDFWLPAPAARFAGDANFFIAFFQIVQLFVGKFLDIDEVVARGMMGADEFVQLQVQGLGVSVLRVLDEKDDQGR